MSLTWPAPAMIFVLVGGFATLAGCTESSDVSAIGAITTRESSEACDDRVELADEPPDAAQSAGMTHGVGRGDIWFFAAEGGRWGDDVINNGTAFQRKSPMWVGTDELPAVSVVRTTSDRLAGTMSLSPTSDGLPGPLPALALFPSPGCWRITATLGGDTATITVHVA